MPKFKNADEYIISVNEREYIASNRHCEVILNGKNDLYYFVHYLSYQELQKRLGSEINQVIMSKSIVITRFRVTAESASKAIEANFEKWLSTLNLDIPLLINALRYHLDERLYDLPDCNDIAKFCPIYVICQGDKISVPLKFAAHIAANQIQSFTKFSCNISDIEDFCSGKKSIDTSKVILDKAQFLYSSGEFVMACILACIACETHLSKGRRVRSFIMVSASGIRATASNFHILSYPPTFAGSIGTPPVLFKILHSRPSLQSPFHNAPYLKSGYCGISHQSFP